MGEGETAAGSHQHLPHLRGGTTFAGVIRGAHGGARWPDQVVRNVSGCSHVLGRAAQRCQTYEWQAAVVADSNLGLIGVDEDPGVTVRTTASIARYNPVVSPADGLLVDELHGRVGLGLWKWLADCDDHDPVSPCLCSIAHLEIEVGLLEARTRHCLLPWPLTSGPDTLPVWRLGQLRGQLALGLWHGRLCRGGGRHRLGVQLAGCGGKRAWREPREPAG